MLQVNHLKAFTDNYIWILTNGPDMVIIDPGEADIVLDYITNNNMNLQAILLTHGHADHVGGVSSICRQFSAPIYGIADMSTNMVSDGVCFNLLGCVVKVMYNPGHTYDGVSYIVSDNISDHLFCGDTLFAGGCGRVFTNDYKIMLDSLDRFKQLNKDTLVYCGHEYTLKNLAFAQILQPHNMDIKQRIEDDKNKLSKQGITLPCTIGQELKTNLFLRLEDVELQSAIQDRCNNKLHSRLEYFKQLRKLRNDF